VLARAVGGGRGRRRGGTAGGAVKAEEATLRDRLGASGWRQRLGRRSRAPAGGDPALDRASGDARRAGVDGPSRLGAGARRLPRGRVPAGGRHHADARRRPPPPRAAPSGRRGASRRCRTSGGAKGAGRGDDRPSVPLRLDRDDHRTAVPRSVHQGDVARDADEHQPAHGPATAE
jgi:hypothetical protein